MLADETVGELILGPQASAFLNAHPSFSVVWAQHACAEGRKHTDVDLVLRYALAGSVHAHAQKLGEQRLLTCAAPQYVRKRGVPHHPLDLRQHNHDGVIASGNSSRSSGWRFTDGTKRLAVRVPTRAVVPSISTALALTLGGAGITQIPECWGLAYVRSGQLIRLLPDWEESLHLWAIQPRGAQNPDTAALLRFVRTLIDMGAPARACHY